jgi:hypothetical protein
MNIPGLNAAARAARWQPHRFGVRCEFQLLTDAVEKLIVSLAPT